MSTFPVEDCRDYLRTGRCKYGMSCKYNHPPNVQNGGGIKPSDPTEMCFPVRPNEPVCAYFMKHRTCKFGSACKFNHPMHLPPGSSPYINNNSGMATSTSSSSNRHDRRSEPVQLLLSPVEATGQVMMMQYLPQRPGEPDCIYFLKNRSCKYGATCRYHHPVLQTNPQESPRPLHNGNQAPQRVQYVMPNYSSRQQVMVSSEAPIAVITVDGNNMNNNNNQGLFAPGEMYCRPAGSVGFTEQSSSASSVGSSLETSNGGDFLPLGDNSSRIRRNTSVGSFNSEARYHLSHSTSDGNIAASRRTRASSFGELPSSNGGTTWSQRARASSSYGARSDHQSQPYHPYGSSASQRRATNGSVRRGRVGGPPDEGFTRMTSALLSMLDTPEEAASESGEEDSPHKATTRIPTIDDADASDALARLHVTPEVPHEIIPTTDVTHDRESQGFYSSSLNGDGGHGTAALQSDGSSWSSSWTGAKRHTQENDEQGNFLTSMFHPNQSSATSNHHHNRSDVGMYLP